MMKYAVRSVLLGSVLASAIGLVACSEGTSDNAGSGGATNVGGKGGTGGTTTGTSGATTGGSAGAAAGGTTAGGAAVGGTAGTAAGGAAAGGTAGAAAGGTAGAAAGGAAGTTTGGQTNTAGTGGDTTAGTGGAAAGSAGTGGASTGGTGGAGSSTVTVWDFEASAAPFRYEASSQYDNFNQGIEDQAVQVTTGPAHHGSGSMKLTIKPANIGVLSNTDCSTASGVGTCTLAVPTDCKTDCSKTDLYEMRLGETTKADADGATIVAGDTITFWVYVPSGADAVKLTKAEIFINSGDPYWSGLSSSPSVTSFPNDTWVPVSLVVPSTWGTDCSTGGVACVPLNRVSINFWFDATSGVGPFYVCLLYTSPSPRD